MVRRIDWESQIGRRLKLRDLHVFYTTVQRGSMAKAAQQLGVSQPVVSEIIADLENALGVRLLDRHRHGVEPTKWTDAIATILSPLMEKFARQYPRVVLRSYEVTRPLDPGLRDRSLDFTLGYFVKSFPYNRFIDDFNLEVVFDDRQVVAAGMSSPWAGRRRKTDLAELVDEPWVLTEGPDSWNYRVVEEAFRTRGLRMPRISVMTFSPQVRIAMLASGHFITTLPTSVLRFHADRRSIKVLPVDLPDRPCPVVIVTLKNRTLNPVVERFIAHIRDFTRPMRDERAMAKA